MKLIHSLSLLLAVALGPASHVFAAPAVVLSPFQDELYTIRPYDGILRRCDAAINARTLKLSRMNGRHVIYDFNEQRDVNGRDVPTSDGKWQNVAQAKYITPLNERDQRKFDLPVVTIRGARVLENNEVGNPNGAKFAIIFIHGAAGIYANRDLGVKDETFSGNFNRLKNLVVRNGGVYYTPSIKDFVGEGPEDVSGLIEHISRVSPRAPIVLSCASSGASVCAGVAKIESAARRLAGIIVMGATWDSDFIGSPAHRAQVPVVFAQGTCDRGNPYDNLFGVFQKILTLDNSYPTQFQGFADGVHGTPLRMLNWRDTLNWIFSVQK